MACSWCRKGMAEPNEMNTCCEESGIVLFVYTLCVTCAETFRKGTHEDRNDLIDWCFENTRTHVPTFDPEKKALSFQ